MVISTLTVKRALAVVLLAAFILLGMGLLAVWPIAIYSLDGTKS